LSQEQEATVAALFTKINNEKTSSIKKLLSKSSFKTFFYEALAVDDQEDPFL
jgi:hypothetical protein